MLFIRGYKKNFFSLLLVLCLSHQAISKAHVCLNTFGTQNRFIKETEGLSDVNWSAREGWGVFKQEQIFTEKEIEFIRKKLESTKHIELNLINFKTNEVFQKANKLFGNIIASKLSDYVLEVLKFVTNKTQDSYQVNLWVRNENSYKFEAGHNHRDNSLTVTRAEVGESSWLAPEGPGTKSITINEKDVGLVFTNQFHGGTMEMDPRLLIIVYFDFL